VRHHVAAVHFLGVELDIRADFDGRCVRPGLGNVLKQRVLTALVLIPILIAVLAISGWFAVAVCTVCLLVLD